MKPRTQARRSKPKPPQAKSSRQTLRYFVEHGYRNAKPDLRPASLTQIVLAVDLVEVWRDGPAYCDELCRDFLLDFRAWRLQKRPRLRLRFHFAFGLLYFAF